MSIDLSAPRIMTRLLYPKLAQRLPAADLHRIFGPTYKEREWAPTVARSPSSQVALVVQLRVFRAVGRFLPLKDVPTSGIEYVAQKLGVECETRVLYSQVTLYRHQAAVLEYLGVTSWGDQARALAVSTMTEVAKARTDPADLINAAVDALVRHRFELPALIALRRLAGTVHSAVNGAQWREVCDHLTAKQGSALEALLKVDSQTQESLFAQLCRAPGRASRKNLKMLIERHQWLQELPDPTVALQTIADSKVLQWANEAKRLKAGELREYIKPRRYALLLAVIRQARGQVLDDLTQMLLKLVRKIESKSADRLQEWYAARHHQTDSLVRAFHESLIVHDGVDKPARKVARLEALFSQYGGRERLKESCAEHLRHEKQTWRPFALPVFERLRSTLLRVAGMLPLQATATTSGLLGFVSAVCNEEPPYSDYYLIENVEPGSLPREWRGLVLDDPSNEKAFNRRQLEVVATLELAAAIKAGEMFVNGSLSYDRFWDRLPREAADPASIAAYAAYQGWGEGADGFMRKLKESLERLEGFIERALSDGKDGFIRCGKDGRPIVTAIQALPIPASAIELERQLREHMPERQLLALRRQKILV